MILSADEMLAIVAAGAGSVAVTALVVLCKVCPGCPLHRCRWGRWDSDDSVDLEKADVQKRIRAEYQELHRVENGKGAKPRPGPPSSVTTLLEEGKEYASPTFARPPPPLSVPAKRLRAHGSVQSGNSSSGSPASSPPHHKAQAFAFGTDTSVDDGEREPPELDFALALDPDTDKLGIGIKEVRGVPNLIHGGTPDSFLRILLVRDLKKGWGRRRSSMSVAELRSPQNAYDLTEIRTAVVRHTVCPRWDDFFQADLKEKERKTAVLKFALYTLDRSGTECLRAEAHKSLGRLDLSPAQAHFTAKLREFRPDIGDLTLTLSYLPTAERLSLKVERAGGLRLNGEGSDGKVEEKAAEKEPNVYVKACLLHRGKTLTKERTSLKEGRDPKWCETLTFDLGSAQLDRSAILISVMHQVGGSEGQSEERRSLPPSPRRKAKRKLPSEWALEEGSCAKYSHRVETQHKTWDPEVECKVETLGRVRGWKGRLEDKAYRLKPSLDSRGMSPEEFRQAATAAIRTGLRQIAEEELGQDRQLYKIQWTVCNPNLYTEHRSTKILSPEDFDVKEVVNILLNARNSEESKRAAGSDSSAILLEETEFHVLRAFKAPAIGGIKKHNKFGTRSCSADEWATRKRGLYNPMQEQFEDKLMRFHPACEEWCVPLALVLGRRLLERPEESLKAFHSKHRLVVAEAEQLVHDAGIPRSGPYTIFPHLEKLHRVLGEGFQVNCYTDSGVPRHSFGPNSAKQLNLFFNKTHCYLINNLSGFLARHYNTSGQRARFCLECKKPHHNLGHHRCPKSGCPACRLLECCNTNSQRLRHKSVVCPECQGFFWWPQCLEAHQKNSEVCQARTQCKTCFVKYARAKGHKCGQEYCSACKSFTAFDHWCFMSKDKARTGPRQEMRRFYADLEAVRGEDGHFRPNLLIVQGLQEDQRQDIFWGFSCVQDFLLKAIAANSIYRDSYLVFHNMKGFDGQFVLSAALAMKLDINILCRGQEILSLDIKSANMKLRDSLLFVPGTSLDRFPSIFKLDADLAKGEFPHSLNTPEQLQKEFFEEDGQRFPPQRYFEPEKMKEGRRKVFAKWWEGERARFDADPSRRYVVRDELRRYCSMDVTLLRQGFERYLSAWEKKGADMDVLESITLPSLCNKIFRNKHMEEDSIPLLPPDGFCPDGHETSADELAWVAWQKKKLGLVHLRHSRNSRPIKIAGCEVDAFGWDADHKTYVLEYHGCHWHGCDAGDCPTASRAPKSEAERELRLSKLANTREKRHRLTTLGASRNPHYGPFTYLEIWEHDFRKLLKTDAEMEEFVSSFKKALSLREPLSLREAFMGGRTEVFDHHVEVQPGQRIKYYDFTSLYPSVNACVKEGQEYPVGHPEVYLSTEVDELLERIGGVSKLFGMVHCRVQPPKRLKFPVIPARIGGKLTFPLCRTCTEEQNPMDCAHERTKRSLNVHIATPELHKALEVGYEVEEIYEVWYFPPEKRSSTLLQSFILESYLDKDYASGFPSWADTPQTKEDHANELAKLLKCDVSVDKFEYNPGLRSVAKFALNNFWGYFGKREDNSTTVFLTDPWEWDKLVEDESIEVVAAQILEGGDYLMVQHKPVKEGPGPKSSLLIAAWTTAMARIRLYQVLQQHPNTLYVDTDSAFILLEEGEEGPEALGHLGDLKDELDAEFPGKGAYISSWAATGPKSYSYTVCDRDGNVIGNELKVKGIRLRSDVALDHKTMKSFVHGASPIQVPQTQFKKSVGKQSVWVQDSMKKTGGMSTGKRRLLPLSQHQTTLPFGWQ